MNSEKWFALLSLLFQNMPALQMIFKKEVKTDEKVSDSSKEGQKNI